VQEIAKTDVRFDLAGYRQARCFLDLEQGPGAFAPECWRSSAGRGETILLWGDSHAASLYPGLAASGSDSVDRRFIAQMTKARCPPLMVPPNGASANCTEVNEHVWTTLSRDVPDSVILAGYWLHYISAGAEAQQLLDSIQTTVQRLVRAGVRQVLVLGQLPTWQQPVPRVLLREWTRSGSVPEKTTVMFDPRARPLDRAIGAAMTGTAAVYVSPFDSLCTTDGCRVARIHNGVAYPIVYDESHLTAIGSTELVRNAGMIRPAGASGARIDATVPGDSPVPAAASGSHRDKNAFSTGR
jgi:hypothetical protein